MANEDKINPFFQGKGITGIRDGTNVWRKYVKRNRSRVNRQNVRRELNKYYS